MRNLLEEIIKKIEECGHTIYEVKFVTDGESYCNWEDFARAAEIIITTKDMAVMK